MCICTVVKCVGVIWNILVNCEERSLLKEGLCDSFRPFSCLWALEIAGISSSESMRGRHKRSKGGEKKKKHDFAYWYNWFSLWHQGRQHRDWTNWIIHVINYLKILQRRDKLNIQESNEKQTSTDAASVQTRFEWVLRAKMLLQIKRIKQMTNTGTFYFLSFYLLSLHITVTGEWG